MPLDLDRLKLINKLPSKSEKDLASFNSGWYKIGRSEAFKEGKLLGVDSFPLRLVVWRGIDKKINALNAYCPHMGADLSCGKLVQEGLICPFHGWRWDRDGNCNHIPYSDLVPERAKTKRWNSLEENEHVFIWYDSDGKEPDQRGSRLEINTGDG